MHVLKPILAAALLAIGIGLVCEILLPASAHAVDMAGLVLAGATWIVPLSLLAIPTKPKTSLAAVGASIGILVVAACLSVTGMSLAVITLVFARGPTWAWLSLAIIAAFWIAGIIALNLYKGPSAGRKGDPK